MKAIADEIHKPVRKVKHRRHVRAASRDEIWSMDLVDMNEWKNDNDGEKYMLTVVDVFSRFAWARPMLTKSANDTFAAFIDIVDSSGRQPKKIWVDQGAEFYNSTFKKWMKANGKSADFPVVMYSTFGESKSVIVERFNRTLKTKMWHYFTEENTRRWVDELPRLMSWYNRRVHSKLGMSPWEASKKKNAQKVYLIHNPVTDEEGVKRVPATQLAMSFASLASRASSRKDTCRTSHGKSLPWLKRKCRFPLMSRSHTSCEIGLARFCKARSMMQSWGR